MDNETAVFFDWNSSVGEPNDQEDDFCIRLYKNTLTMGTWSCHDANQYLCEDAPIHGNWSTWTAWSDCSSTCGNGSQSRVRYCDSPYPSGGGAFCTGSSSDDQLCHLGDCSVNGMWSVWTGWSDCIQVQCGVSNRTRSRSCDSPVPTGGGSDCVGVATETEGCVNSTCPPGNKRSCVLFQDFSPDTLKEKIEEITKTLTVNKSTLSTTVRRKTCAEDPRPSSTYIGVVAIVFLGVYFGLLLLWTVLHF
uniref:Ectin-like n=1 Tax=Crassostrea virginica TaxID=6565 RepID=A0A8B8D5Y4_CRAVI|nr:ectin-like [Crassostrea virginica]